MNIELSLSCDQIEDLLQAQYNLDEPVKLTGMEYDEDGDLCAFQFDVEESDTERLHRDWNDWGFAEGLVGEIL